MVVGNPQPTHWGGFTNTFAFRNFDLHAALQFSGGNKIYNGIRAFADDGGYNYDNKFADVLSRWQKPGDITNEPGQASMEPRGANITSSQVPRGRLVHPTAGSNARLQDSERVFSASPGCRIRGSTSRVAICTPGRKFSGYNPDVNSNGSGSNISLGTEFYAYPLARTWMVGVSGEW